MPAETARLRTIDRACAVVLIAFLVWSILGEAVRTGGLGDDALDDHAIARELSVRVLGDGGYAGQLGDDGPAVVFAYPPAYALLHAGLAATGRVTGPLLFMLAVATACGVGVWSCLVGLGADRRPLRWAGVLLGILACRAIVQSDLHLLNSNALVVGLALGASRAFGARPAGPAREAGGGALLAASLSIKPWGAGLVLALAALRRGSAVGWSLFGLALAFGVVPAIALGIEPAIELTRSWVAFVAALATPEAVDRVAVDNVSLPATLAALGWGPAATGVAMRVFQVLWLGGLAALLWLGALRPAARPSLDARRWLLVTATVLVAPVPIGAILQPHHAVAAVPLAVIAAVDALDTRLARGGRAGRLGLLVAVFLATSYAPDGPLRGLAYLSAPALLLVAAWLPAHRLDEAEGSTVPEGARSL